jgi:hemerythrin superfamily protein
VKAPIDPLRLCGRERRCPTSDSARCRLPADELGITIAQHFQLFEPLAKGDSPMVTAKKSPKATAKPQDAIAMLKADHKKVSALFEQFESARAASTKKKIVAQICAELTVHTSLEEEIFYPAVQAALKDHELVPEANVEHGSVKDLIAQVEGVEPNGDLYDARVKVMGEFVKHHVKEEQNEMFPKAKKTKLDMLALGERIAARKAQLMASRGL